MQAEIHHGGPAWETQDGDPFHCIVAMVEPANQFLLKQFAAFPRWKDNIDMSGGVKRLLEMLDQVMRPPSTDAPGS